MEMEKFLNQTQTKSLSVLIGTYFNISHKFLEFTLWLDGTSGFLGLHGFFGLIELSSWQQKS